MIGGAAMAMFAMIASVTYQHRGFFTLLFHISVAVGNPTAMMTSSARRWPIIGSSSRRALPSLGWSCT